MVSPHQRFLLVVLLAVLGSAAVIRGMHDGIATERSGQRPWLYLIIGLPAMIGLLGIALDQHDADTGLAHFH